MPKVLKSTCRKLWCLFACQKINFISNFFFRYCRDIANLLFWELGECLTIPIKNHSINLQETFTLICMQKINFILHGFFWYIAKILQTCYFGYTCRKLVFIYRQTITFFEDIPKMCKLLILSTLGMPAYTHSQWQ